ncbi:hypothetical protein F889_02586 [Acinetobacter colistiniresistens]|uniref:Holin of 3TMs, for gene-transfer release n=1 Tax=Acinetobacter colistiniresistens TaxID=280145 RepID=N9R450_9GAMM|nr:hypothetical protein [Acinetobacter colistiniresistens]ENX33922.1 hypothetical protein F889_02586 [Acinetobacter colistiniresistens]
MKKTQFKRPRNLVPSAPSVGTIAAVTEKVEQPEVENSETVAELKQKYLDQAKRHQKRVEELQTEIAEKDRMFKPVLLASTPHEGFLVKNSHTFWKWLSTWAFAAICYVSVYGVPAEVIALVPEASQNKVTAVLALLGFVGRFINQSKPKPLPPASDTLKENADV